VALFWLAILYFATVFSAYGQEKAEQKTPESAQKI
jgi:cbb3-type cytochrome oxidase subunit 3